MNNRLTIEDIFNPGARIEANRVSPQELVKQLRLGNRIIAEGEEAIVEGIQPWHVWTSKKTGYIQWDDVKPIPLTPQWLERMGFKINVYKIYTVIVHKGDRYEHFKIWQDEEGLYIPRNSAAITRISYVHQLQNLYFALTSEELTIKETV